MSGSGYDGFAALRPFVRGFQHDDIPPEDVTGEIMRLPRHHAYFKHFTRHKFRL